MKTSPSLIFPLHRFLACLAIGGMVAVNLISALKPAFAQEEHKRKIPVVDKIEGETNHQAFSGTVASVDTRQRVLEVNATEGKDIEIFPVKKGVSIATADGKKTKLRSLVPGLSVMVYYQLQQSLAKSRSSQQPSGMRENRGDT